MAKVKKNRGNRKPRTEAQKLAGEHNRFIGHCAMMKAQTSAMLIGRTTTAHQKMLARQLGDLAATLENELRDARAEAFPEQRELDL